MSSQKSKQSQNISVVGLCWQPPNVWFRAAESSLTGGVSCFPVMPRLEAAVCDQGTSGSLINEVQLLKKNIQTFFFQTVAQLIVSPGKNTCQPWVMQCELLWVHICTLHHPPPSSAFAVPESRDITDAELWRLPCWSQLLIVFLRHVGGRLATSNQLESIIFVFLPSAQLSSAVPSNAGRLSQPVRQRDEGQFTVKPEPSVCEC